MPKLKTNKAAAKRFKVTGTGKVMREKAYTSHLLTKKSAERKRRLGKTEELRGGDKRRVKKLLGI